MDYLKQANQIIETALRRLHELITAALNEGAFSEVQRLAGIAESIRTTLGGQLPPADRALSSSDALANRAKASKGRSARYPQFETDGPRLIKIGWSNREKSTYEHKAPRELCEAVFEKLASKSDQTSFRMDDVLPTFIGETEIPSYQAYLVLAWLRSLDLIRKRSKDTYQWTRDDLDKHSFNEAWQLTKERHYG